MRMALPEKRMLSMPVAEQPLPSVTVTLYDPEGRLHRRAVLPGTDQVNCRFGSDPGVNRTSIQPDESPGQFTSTALNPVMTGPEGRVTV